ncbi:MAG: hypothetical protein K6D38_03470 [Pseudobutyrivibrio sp.]|nr:hypothetical protein [Pseudobutyrivibrio sp.]
MKNEFYTDKKSIRKAIIEQGLWGSVKARVFSVLTIIVFLNIFVCSLQRDEYTLVAVGIGLLYLLTIVKIVNSANKAAKMYGDKRFKHCILISDNEISFEILEDEEIRKKGIHKLSDVKSLIGVKNFAFVYFDNKDTLLLKKKSFLEGSLEDFKQLIDRSKGNKAKRDITEVHNSKVFRITLLVGLVLSVLLPLLFINITVLQENPIIVFFEMFLSGIILFVFIAFGLVAFIDWYKRQGVLLRVLSILFYPISLFVIYLIGIVNTVIYIFAVIKKGLGIKG